MKLAFFPEAEAEFEEAWLFYESRRLGLGDELYTEYRVALERLFAAPHAQRALPGGSRQKNSTGSRTGSSIG